MSFTGRDEDIDDETREPQRYTLSHLAHDVKAQTGVTEPLRDWFPLSASGPFVGPDRPAAGAGGATGAALKCGCHPNCGIGTVLLVNKKTKRGGPALGVLRHATGSSTTSRRSPTRRRGRT